MRNGFHLSFVQQKRGFYTVSYTHLHLAYDRGYNYKTYNTYQEIKENLFFARVDSYARDPKAAPAPKGVELTLTAVSYTHLDVYKRQIWKNGQDR